MINALVVPRFVFLMLQLVKRCSKSWRWRGSQHPQCGQNGDAHFALLLRRPSVSGLLRLFLRAHQLVVAPMSVCVLVDFNCAAATVCRTASQTSWCSVTTSCSTAKTLQTKFRIGNVNTVVPARVNNQDTVTDCATARAAQKQSCDKVSSGTSTVPRQATTLHAITNPTEKSCRIRTIGQTIKIRQGDMKTVHQADPRAKTSDYRLADKHSLYLHASVLIVNVVFCA